MSGSLNHILVQPKFVEVNDTLSIDEIRVPSSSNYILIFPNDPPSTNSLSLVVHAIDNNVVSTIWGASTTENMGLTNGTASIFIEPPDSISNSYSIVFPDSSATSLVGKVMAIKTESAREIELEFKDFSQILDVRMTDNASGNALKFLAHPDQVDTFSMSFSSDFASGKANMIEKVIYVENDDSSGKVVLGLEDPYRLFPISFSSLTFEMNPSQTNDCEVSFPDYRNDDESGKLIGCIAQGGETVKLGYLLDPVVDAAVFENLTLSYASSSTIDIVVPEPIQRNIATHNLSDLQFAYEGAMVVVKEIDTRSRVVLELAQASLYDPQTPTHLFSSQTAGSGDIVASLPQYDSTLSKVGYHVVVSSDDNAGNIALSFENTIRIIDDLNFNTTPPTYTRLATKANISNFDLYFPSFEQALTNNELRSMPLRIGLLGSQEARLQFESGSVIYNNSYTRNVTLSPPSDFAALNSSSYTLTLPSFDPVVANGDGYAGRVLSVISSSQNQIVLDFVSLSQFTQIKSLGLSSDSGATVSTLLSSTSPTTNTTLVLPSATPSFGQVLTVSSVSVTPSKTTKILEFTEPMTLISNTGLFCRLIAKPSQSQSYNITFPADYASKENKTFLLDSSGKLVLTDPTRIDFTRHTATTLANNYQRISVRSHLAISYTLSPPSDPPSSVLGHVIVAKNQANATALEFEFAEAGRVVCDNSTLTIRCPASLSASMSIEFPVHSLDYSDKILFTSFSNGVHSLSFSNFVAQDVLDQANSKKLTLSQRSGDEDFAYDLRFRETSLASSFPVKRSLVSSSTSHVSARLASTAPVAGTYAATGNGVGDTLSGTGALSLDSISAVLNDVVLLKNQTESAENGIYVVLQQNPFILERHSSFDRHDRCIPGIIVEVQAGSQSGKKFIANFVAFNRLSRGIVRTQNDVLVSEDGHCNFASSGDVVINQNVLMNGQAFRITSIVSETEITVTPFPSLQIEQTSLLLGIIVGRDPINFVEIDGDLSVSRLDVEFLEKPEFERIEIGPSLVLQASDNDQEFKIPDFAAVGKVLAASVSNGVVSVTEESPSEIMHVSGDAFFVSLPGSGSDFKSQTMSDISGASFALAFDGLAATSSSQSCFTLVDAPYGTLANSTEHVYECMRTGIYIFTLTLNLTVDSRAVTVDHAKGKVTISLKKTDGLFENAATAAADLSLDFEDTTVLSSGVGGQTTIFHSFIVDTTATTQFRIEIEHQHKNPADTNGTFRIANASLLIESVD